MKSAVNAVVDSTVAHQSESSLLSDCGRLGTYIFKVVKNLLCRARDILLCRRSHKPQNCQLIGVQQTNSVRAAGHGQSMNKDLLHPAKEASLCESTNSDTPSFNNKAGATTNNDQVENSSDLLLMRGWTADLAKLEGSMKMWEYMRDTYTPESAFGRHAREMLEKNEPRRASLKVVTLKDGYEHNGGYSY